MGAADPGVGRVKVALVQPKFEPTGGAERYALNLAVGLAARGHRVDLYGRRAGALPAGCRFHRLPALPLGRALKTYSFWRAAQWGVPAGRYDVVQGSGKTSCQTIHRTGGGVHRAYLERAGEGPRSCYDRVVLRIEDRLFAAPGLRMVLCPSRWVAAEVVRHYPAVQDRVRVLANGVDTETYSPAGREASRRLLAAELGLGGTETLLLFVATNFRLKGLDLALGALARVADAHLVVVGGDDPAPFQGLVRDLGVEGRVHFRGGRADAGPEYRAADLFLHPTRYDPFANVCLEALACGTPVVTTERNGVADLLEEPEGGVVVPLAEWPAGAAAAAARLLARGENGRERARHLAERHSASRHLDAVETLYRSLRAGPSR